MKCPHCLQNFFEAKTFIDIGEDADGYWAVSHTEYPSCKRHVRYLASGKAPLDPSNGLETTEATVMIRPRGSSRPCPGEVPADLAEDFVEACLVFPDSPKSYCQKLVTVVFRRRVRSAFLRP